jgi:hypothetical protein
MYERRSTSYCTENWCAASSGGQMRPSLATTAASTRSVTRVSFAAALRNSSSASALAAARATSSASFQAERMGSAAPPGEKVHQKNKLLTESVQQRRAEIDGEVVQRGGNLTAVEHVTEGLAEELENAPALVHREGVVHPLEELVAAHRAVVGQPGAREDVDGDVERVRLEVETGVPTRAVADDDVGRTLVDLHHRDAVTAQIARRNHHTLPVEEQAQGTSDRRARDLLDAEAEILGKEADSRNTARAASWLCGGMRYHLLPLRKD